MFECKVYRDSWLRGVPGKGLLHRESDNKMCCLGQIAFQAGVPIHLMTSLVYLSNVDDDFGDKSYPKELGGLVFAREERDVYHDYWKADDTDDANEAMSSNDSSELTEEEREAKIAKSLNNADIIVTFVDGVAPWFLPEAECLST